MCDPSGRVEAFCERGGCGAGNWEPFAQTLFRLVGCGQGRFLLLKKSDKFSEASGSLRAHHTFGFRFWLVSPFPSLRGMAGGPGLWEDPASATALGPALIENLVFTSASLPQSRDAQASSRPCRIAVLRRARDTIGRGDMADVRNSRRVTLLSALFQGGEQSQVEETRGLREYG